MRVVGALEQSKIPYMVTGAVVSSLQGEPRATHDIDIVVEIDPFKVKTLMDAFPEPDFFLQESAIRQAIEQHSMFNLLFIEEGLKVDFWILQNEPYDRERFRRRYTESFTGIDIAVSTPEDTILSKLLWAKKIGGSEKQFTDALRVYEVQYSKLDLEYLRKWVVRLGIKELWQRIQNEAENI